MLNVLAHITPLEAPVVWFAFGAGLVVGVLGTLAVVRRLSSRRAG